MKFNFDERVDAPEEGPKSKSKKKEETIASE